MTPKEKAKQLWNKFANIADSWVEGRQCALIAVDEIINSREDDRAFDDTLSSASSEYYTPHPLYLTYWKLVKQEISKL